MTVSKELIQNVKDLKVALNEISVYDLDVYTSMELYYKIANKLNEVIKELARFEGVLSDEVVEQNEKLLYLLGEGLTTEVIKKINQMVTDGTMDNIINHNVFNGLNNKIDTFKNEVDEQFISIKKKEIVSIMDYGAIGDKVNDDTNAIKQALLNGRYVTAKGELHYIISGIIEIPENVTLDFNNAYVTFTNSNACFKLKKSSSLKNVRVLISSGVILNKSVVYIEGNDVFHVGWSHTPNINNITIQQNVSGQDDVAYRKNIGIWLDARQNLRDTSCCISGVIVDNVKGVLLKHIIYSTVGDQLNNTGNVYITSNTFKNIEGYNCHCFIKDEIVTNYSNKVGVGSNVYDNLHFQPADNIETYFIDLSGGYNVITNALFWDNGRPSNQSNQIVLRGDYNSVTGTCLPPYKSNYVDIQGNYNFYQGHTYGIPTQYFGGKYISGRGYQKEWKNKLLPISYNYSSTVAKPTSGTIEGSNDTILANLDLTYGDLGVGLTRIEIESVGTCEKTTEIRRFWCGYGTTKYYCGASSPSVYGETYKAKAVYVIRKYVEGYADVVVDLLYYINGSNIVHKVVSEKIYNITNDGVINPTLRFGSTSNGNMTQQYATIKIDFHE